MALLRDSARINLPCVLHMSCDLRYFSASSGRLGVREFERSIGSGDRAYDLGTVLGSYLAAATRNCETKVSRANLKAIVCAYRPSFLSRDPGFLQRTWCFAACSVLHSGTPVDRAVRVATALLHACGDAKTAEQLPDRLSISPFRRVGWSVADMPAARG
jgi:hypothetical protein